MFCKLLQVLVPTWLSIPTGLVQFSSAAVLLSYVWSNFAFNITLPIHGVHAWWPGSKGWLLANATSGAAAVLSAADGTDGEYFPDSPFAPSELQTPVTPSCNLKAVRRYILFSTNAGNSCNWGDKHRRPGSVNACYKIKLRSKHLELTCWTENSSKKLMSIWSGLLVVHKRIPRYSFLDWKK